MHKHALIALLVAAAVTPAYAGSVYVAGSVGRSSADISKSDIDNDLISAGATGVSSKLDKDDTAYKAQVGYQFNENFAVEGGYVDLGKARYSATYSGGRSNASVKSSGPVIAALGIMPLNESFSIFGKLGVIYAKVESSVDATGPGGAASGSSSSTKLKTNWGGGVTYNINKQFGIRAEYEQFRKLGDSSTTGESNVNMLSAGVVYTF